jgi:integral membrane sensor domain MASE1
MGSLIRKEATMSADSYKEMLPEGDESLWWLAAPPAIWLLHFFGCYVSAALWCEKIAGRTSEAGTLRWIGLVLTVVALAGLALLARRGYRRFRADPEAPSLESDTAESRHRFLGFAELLLCMMSMFGVVYVALPYAVGVSCR